MQVSKIFRLTVKSKNHSFARKLAAYKAANQKMRIFRAVIAAVVFALPIYADYAAEMQIAIAKKELSALIARKATTNPAELKTIENQINVQKQIIKLYKSGN
jgi:hypothetical protein